MSNMMKKRNNFNQVVTCHPEDAHTKVDLKPSLEPYFICCSYDLNFLNLNDFSYGDFVLQLMCLADLELDFINPYDLATKINKVVMLEFLSHGSLCVLHLLSGHWLMFLLCLPYVYYNATL